MKKIITHYHKNSRVNIKIYVICVSYGNKDYLIISLWGLVTFIPALPEEKDNLQGQIKQLQLSLKQKENLYD